MSHQYRRQYTREKEREHEKQSEIKTSRDLVKESSLAEDKGRCKFLSIPDSERANVSPMASTYTRGHYTQAEEVITLVK